MKKANKTIILIAIIFIMLLFVFKVFNIQNIVLKWIYPIKYSEYVDKYANEYNLDKLLVYAIIKAESNFDPNIVSNSGAIGLMQLMENTAKEIASQIEFNEYTKETLYEPDVNIMLGTKYFSNLVEYYNGNISMALTAYNAGIGNVSKWIANGIIQADGSDIENIPFKETNTYVRKILRDYQIYQEIYK
ncbi:MAG: lytic transglycosylase domain-containing protein [Clostridia bacterium]|nr:lytic transglycosylase domain-containing protein [Clostridia bacterium]